MTALSREQEDYLLEWAESGNKWRIAGVPDFPEWMLEDGEMVEEFGAFSVRLSEPALALAHYIKRGREMENDAEMACETPPAGCECPGCSIARETEGAGRRGLP